MNHTATQQKFTHTLLIILFGTSIVALGARELKLHPTVKGKPRVSIEKVISDLKGSWSINQLAEDRRKKWNDTKDERKNSWKNFKEFFLRAVP